MGHDKLRKFAENETFACLVQPSAAELLADGFANLHDHALKGHWREWFLGGRPSSASVPCFLSEAKSASADVPELLSDAKREGTAEREAVGAVPLGGAGGLTRNRVPRMIGAPIILELGCGKGEYTLELARRNPDKFYIGVDIKGARLWRGAKTATEEGLRNVAFLRTRIEFIGAFFGPDEVSEIWLTFSDPQMKSENSRLTSPVFLERYRRFLKPGGIVHLKTDSRFLHLYTLAVATVNGFPILSCTENLYCHSEEGEARRMNLNIRVPSEVREVQTYYESMFLNQGLPITYMAFTIDGTTPVAYPRDPEDFDSKAMRSAEKSRLDPTEVYR